MHWMLILLCIYYSIMFFFLLVSLYTHEVPDNIKYIIEVRTKNIMYSLKTKLERVYPYRNHMQYDTVYSGSTGPDSLEIPIQESTDNYSDMHAAF